MSASASGSPGVGRGVPGGGEMEDSTTQWLAPFDKLSRLLLHALMSGPSGALVASQTLQRIQSRQIPGQQPFDWMSLMGTLCREEPSLEGPEKSLTLKPLFFLLPLQCQRNLLRFLHMAHPVIPRACLSKLIEAMGHDASSDPWILALRALLQRDLEGESSSLPLGALTDRCQQQLRDLCRGITREETGALETKSKLGWYRVSWHKDYCKGIEEGMGPKSQNSRKRKNPDVTPDSPPWGLELGQHAKRSRSAEDGLDVELFEGLKAGPNTPAAMEEDNLATGRPASQTRQSQMWDHGQQRAKPEEARELPESIQLSVPRLKEILETEAESLDPLTASELQVLNECDSSQLALLCSLLQVSELSEQALLQFCTKLQALCPDLSYMNAAVLSKSLFLNRVLLLTEPASRLLITALTLFCSKYARATCSSLIGPLLQTPEKGPVLVEFLCRIIEECLEREHLIPVFSEVLEAPWSEEVLTVLHALLGRGVDLPSAQFDVLIQKLSHWAPDFIKSMKFAKLMLNVLTKYQGHIQMSHQKPLSNALALNETFLKKSLQAALKRLPVS